jgi:predicted PurR-regulated permease PerM
MDKLNLPLKQNSTALNVAAFIIIIAGMIYAAPLINSLLLALFISIICAQPIQWLYKKGVPQSLAILIVFIGIIATFFIFGEMISKSLSTFSQNAPLYEQNLKEMGTGFTEFFEKSGIDISNDKMAELLNPGKVMGVTAGVLSQLGGFMSNTLTIIFLVLFMLMEVDSLGVKIKAVAKNQSNSFTYLNVIGTSIRHYLSIKTLTSLITGVLIWIGLKIIGLDYAILWALIAFLLNYIPTFGSIIAAIPAILFSLIQLKFTGVIETLIVFAAVNVIIGNVVEPKMMGVGLGLSTFVVFFSLLFWGFVLGTIGMFLSVPLTMAIKIMLEQKPKTKGLAIFLGTQQEAQIIVDNDDKIN